MTVSQSSRNINYWQQDQQLGYYSMESNTWTQNMCQPQECQVIIHWALNMLYLLLGVCYLDDIHNWDSILYLSPGIKVGKMKKTCLDWAELRLWQRDNVWVWLLGIFVREHNILPSLHHSSLLSPGKKNINSVLTSQNIRLSFFFSNVFTKVKMKTQPEKGKHF